MDVNNDGLFEEFNQEQAPVSEMNAPSTEVKLPFPDEDFNEFGKVKKLRGRMLKKLLRQEWKFYLPTMSLLSVLVLAAGIIFSVLLRFMIEKPEAFDNNFFPLFFAGWAITYVYGTIGLSIFSMIYPVYRYNKNFFQNEGYLTFSIPASAEEQLFAKRIAAIVCQAVSVLVTLVSITLVLLIAGVTPAMLGEVFAPIGDFFALEPMHAVLFTVELLLTLIVTTLMGPCVYGAVSCGLSKSTGQKKIGVSILIVFLVVGAVESVVSGFTSFVIIPLSYAGPIGLHIALWLGIIVNAAITVACFLFELHFLKKKLDLK